jgi:hypothetical protein
VGPESRPRRTRRGEGEVTQWPRGLVDYTPRETPDTAPDPEEDRTGNRIRLAARLIGVMRSEGQDVEREVAALRSAEAAYAAGRRDEATERVERLLAELHPTAAASPPTRRHL